MYLFDIGCNSQGKYAAVAGGIILFEVRKKVKDNVRSIFNYLF